MIVAIAFASVTEIDFVIEMIKGLYLKRQHITEYVERFTRRGKKNSMMKMMDCIIMKSR
jgi:hypothetical protein